MFFRNAHPYRLHGDHSISFETLQDAVAEKCSRPLGGSEPTRMGWTAPAGRNSEILVHEVQGQRLLTALHQERKLPGAVVKEEVEERCAELERITGQAPNRRQKQEIKEKVYEELLPRAFVVSKRIDVWWDPARNLICINTGSSKQAESALDLLRETLGSLKVTPLATKALPVRRMTEWLNDAGTRPAWLALGEKATLQARDESAFVAKQADLEGEEVQTMLASGHQATQLAINAESLASLTLTDGFTLKGLKFDDALIEEANDMDDGGDAIGRLETDFILMTSALNELIDHLVDALDGEAVAGEAGQDQAAA